MAYGCCPTNLNKLSFWRICWLQSKTRAQAGKSFRLPPLTETIEQDILARFRADREEEYAEFYERSQEFLAEIKKETGKLKFTFAELEENEQDFQRLTNWLEKIKKRDFVGGDEAQKAIETLKTCRTAFEIFSTEVYNRQAPGDTPGVDLVDE